MVVNVLLNQLRPNLSKNNLGVPAINKSQILVISDEIVERKLPSIFEIILRNFRTFIFSKRAIKGYPRHASKHFLENRLQQPQRMGPNCACKFCCSSLAQVQS